MAAALFPLFIHGVVWPGKRWHREDDQNQTGYLSQKDCDDDGDDGDGDGDDADAGDNGCGNRGLPDLIACLLTCWLAGWLVG